MESNNKQVLFIFGCQRSGTTATLEYFKELRIGKVYDETNDAIHTHNSTDSQVKIRLCRKEVLLKIIAEQTEDKIIIKPLVESQHAKKLLEEIPNSVGLWMYRNPKDAIASMLKEWKGDVGRGLVNAIINKKEYNWRSEKVNSEIRDLVLYLNKNIDLKPADMAGIFWYVRNSFFFSQQLHKNAKVVKSKYKPLVTNSTYLSNRLKNIGFELKEKKNDFFNSKSVNKGKQIQLNPVVNQLCFDLFRRFDNS